MSCMGGATAPLSSSSSESALGLLSDLATAWFSMDPLPSPPASGCLPVISSTAASTATERENTSVTCQTGHRDILTHGNTFLWQFSWQLSKYFTLDQSVNLITGRLIIRLTDISITIATLLSMAKNRHGLDCTYSQEVCISWKFPWAHPLEQRDPAARNNHRLFEF